MNTAQIDYLEDLAKLQSKILIELHKVAMSRDPHVKDMGSVWFFAQATDIRTVLIGITNVLTAVKAAAAYEASKKTTKYDYDKEVAHTEKPLGPDFLCGAERQPNPFLEAVDQVRGKPKKMAILEDSEWPKGPPPKATRKPRKQAKPGKHTQQAKTVARFVQDQDNLAGYLYGKRVVIPVYEEAKARHQANRLNCPACGYENTRTVTKFNPCAACRYKAGIGILPWNWNEFVRKTLRRVWGSSKAGKFDPTLIKPYARAPEEAMAIYNDMQPKKITKHKQAQKILEDSLKADPCPACHKTGVQDVTRTKPCRYCGWRDGTGVEPKDWKKYVRDVLQFTSRVRKAKQHRTTKRDKKPTKASRKLELTPEDFEEPGAQ